MAVIKVGGKLVDVDIRCELEKYSWHHPRWSEDKLIAASPFRYDRTPSFFVNLQGRYAGTWKDSGAYDEEWQSGNLTKLLTFLRNETYEETCQYLENTYFSQDYLKTGYFKLSKIHLQNFTKLTILKESVIDDYKFRHTYLNSRGIPEKVQRFMGVGYSKKDRAVTIPWRHHNGYLANVKYRKVHGKAFWYLKGAEPVRNLVYGIDKVYKYNLKEVYVCEAEIDAMTWYASGKPAIAIGGTSVTDKQLEMIRKSPIETLIIARDNDKPGGKLERQLAEKMAGYVRVKVVSIPDKYKDANEAHVAGIDLSELVPEDVEIKI